MDILIKAFAIVYVVVFFLAFFIVMKFEFGACPKQITAVSA